MERLLRDSWKQYMAPAEIGSLSEEAGRTQSILQIGIHLEGKNVLNQNFKEHHQPELFCRTFDTWSPQRQPPPLSCKSKYCQRWPSRFRSGICACPYQFPRTLRLIRESSFSDVKPPLYKVTTLSASRYGDWWYLQISLQKWWPGPLHWASRARRRQRQFSEGPAIAS